MKAYGRAWLYDVQKISYFFRVQIFKYTWENMQSSRQSSTTALSLSAASAAVYQFSTRKILGPRFSWKTYSQYSNARVQIDRESVVRQNVALGGRDGEWVESTSSVLSA